MPLKDEQIKVMISDVIGTSRRGRRKVIVLVRKKNPEIGSSRIRRVYEREGFSLMKKYKKRIVHNGKNPAEVPLARNEEWAVDFMHDALNTGRQIRSLNIIDEYNRECLGMFIRHNIPAVRVTEFLDYLIEQYGKPKKIRSDNGPEFTSKHFQLWLDRNNIGWSKIEKGKPQQNCFIERFNRTAREDFFDANIFFHVEQANHLAEIFMHDYNYIRPHESLNDLTPKEYAA